MFLCMFIAWNGIEGLFQLLMKHFFWGFNCTNSRARRWHIWQKISIWLGKHQIVRKFCHLKKEHFYKTRISEDIAFNPGWSYVIATQLFLRTPWFFDGRYMEIRWTFHQPKKSPHLKDLKLQLAKGFTHKNMGHFFDWWNSILAHGMGTKDLWLNFAEFSKFQFFTQLPL